MKKTIYIVQMHVIERTVIGYDFVCKPGTRLDYKYFHNAKFFNTYEEAEDAGKKFCGNSNFFITKLVIDEPPETIFVSRDYE